LKEVIQKSHPNSPFPVALSLSLERRFFGELKDECVTIDRYKFLTIEVHCFGRFESIKQIWLTSLFQTGDNQKSY